MKNITLAIEGSALNEVCEAAARRRVSGNGLVRDLPHDLVKRRDLVKRNDRTKAARLEFMALSRNRKAVRALAGSGVRSALMTYQVLAIALAARSGSFTSYNEDLNHGQFYGTVRVLNPFSSA